MYGSPHGDAKRDGIDGRTSTEKLQNNNDLLEFNEQISSLIIAMKPKISQMYFRRFTREMVKEFFRSVREEFEADGAEKKKDMQSALPPQLLNQFVTLQKQMKNPSQKVPIVPIDQMILDQHRESHEYETSKNRVSTGNRMTQVMPDTETNFMSRNQELKNQYVDVKSSEANTQPVDTMLNASAEEDAENGEFTGSQNASRRHNFEPSVGVELKLKKSKEKEQASEKKTSVEAKER